MRQKSCSFACTCAYILLCCASAYAHFTNETEAFHDVLHFVHGPFTDKTSLSGDDLEEIYHEMFEKAECDEKAAYCSMVSFVSSGRLLL